jgi:elongation of very long chain fatty acids protein 6
MTYLDLTVPTVPNYSYVFNFEEEFVHQDTRVWMIENWKNGFYYVGIYMILIFGGQHYMQSRPRFQLRGVLVMWNTALACFSIVGACRTLPELLHTLKNHGVYHSVCIPR